MARSALAECQSRYQVIGSGSTVCPACGKELTVLAINNTVITKPIDPHQDTSGLILNMTVYELLTSHIESGQCSTNGIRWPASLGPRTM